MRGQWGGNRDLCPPHFKPSYNNAITIAHMRAITFRVRTHSAVDAFGTQRIAQFSLTQLQSERPDSHPIGWLMLLLLLCGCTYILTASPKCMQAKLGLCARTLVVYSEMVDDDKSNIMVWPAFDLEFQWSLFTIKGVC